MVIMPINLFVLTNRLGLLVSTSLLILAIRLGFELWFLLSGMDSDRLIVLLIVYNCPGPKSLWTCTYVLSYTALYYFDYQTLISFFRLIFETFMTGLVFDNG